MNNVYTVRVEQDPDDPDNLILPLPEELLEKMSWEIGDNLEWINNNNGTFTLKKVGT